MGNNDTQRGKCYQRGTLQTLVVTLLYNIILLFYNKDFIMWSHSYSTATIRLLSSTSVMVLSLSVIHDVNHEEKIKLVLCVIPSTTWEHRNMS